MISLSELLYDLALIGVALFAAFGILCAATMLADRLLSRAERRRVILRRLKDRTVIERIGHKHSGQGRY